MSRAHVLRLALLLPLALGGVGRAQSEGAARVPDLGPHPSVGDLMLAVAAVHPTFAGVYVNPGGGPGVHVNAAGPIDAPAVVALLDSLYSLNGNHSVFAEYAARGVAAHPVTYTYAQLHEWNRRAMRVLSAETGGHFGGGGIDERHNRISLRFWAGISPEEIERLLATLDVPRDALFFRSGGVIMGGPISVPRE